MHSSRQDGKKRSFSIQDILETGATSVASLDDKGLCRPSQAFGETYMESVKTIDLQEEQNTAQHRFLDLQKYRHKRPDVLTRGKKYRDVVGTTLSEKKDEGQKRFKESSLKYLKEEICSENKRKKSRTVFSRRQIYQLETAFDSRRYLSSSERSYLAQSLDLTETQIKIWFQNRRNKWKRQWQTNGSACNNNHNSNCVAGCPPPVPVGHFMREARYPDARSFCCHGIPPEALQQSRPQCHCNHLPVRQPAYLQIPCFPEPLVNWQQHESGNVRGFYRF